MNDGVEEIEPDAPRARLVYPFDQGPQVGEAIDIAAGVKWLRMPLSGPLGFINVWAVAEAGGWAIIDTGIGGSETMQAWRKAFAGPLMGRPVTRVFATHMHPDHVGMAGWLTRKFNARLWMSRLEYVTCLSLASDTGREAPQDGIDFFRAAGWDEAAIEDYRTRFGFFGKAMHPLPDSFRRLSDGDDIRIGDHQWRVVVGSGHSPEHACLLCPDLQILISGDQVLPRISSNVSVFPSEPDANPLNDWLGSLARIRAKIADDVLVLPAHNDPFFGLHARLDHLIEGHERGLERLGALLAEPRRVMDCFPALFRRPIDSRLLGLATGETLAHLNWLLARGLAARTRDANGIDWYRAI